MNVPSKDDLRLLAEKQGGPCVTILMPSYRTGTESQQNQIRLKNLMRQAEDQLTATGMRTPQAKEFLKPVQDLLDNSHFWRHQGCEGLAVYVGRDLFRTFDVPLELQESLTVGKYFEIEPLLPLLAGEERFHILALSQHNVRLLRCTRFGVHEVRRDEMPPLLADALSEDNPQRAIAFPTLAGPITGPTGGDKAMPSPGRDSNKGVDKAGIVHYYQIVDKGVKEYLGEGGEPLVLVGVEYLHPLYREASSYHNLLEQGVMGSPDSLSPWEMQQQAWAIVEPLALAAREAAVGRFRQLMGEGDARALDDASQVVPAAYYGRVETLFVQRGTRLWGELDGDGGTVNLHAQAGNGNQDLADIAAIYAILNSGKVYAMEPGQMPGRGPLAAICRY